MPTIHAPSFTIIIGAGPSWRHRGSEGCTIEGVAHITRSAYLIRNFGRYIYEIGTKKCAGRAAERPLANSLPLRSSLFEPLQPS